MGIIFDLGLVFFIGLPLGVMLSLYVWLIYKTIKPEIAKTEVTNAYFLKKIRQEIEERKIDFDEMMREYHESVKIWKQTYSEKGVLDRIDEEIDGELGETETKTKK